MSTMQTKHGLTWLVIAAAATVVMPASIVSAAGTSPFRHGGDGAARARNLLAV